MDRHKKRKKVCTKTNNESLSNEDDISGRNCKISIKIPEEIWQIFCTNNMIYAMLLLSYMQNNRNGYSRVRVKDKFIEELLLLVWSG